ncbi:MAG: hypothetical protein HQM08_06550, partial [Candidatus Riflebacteria bacterium]|nr:hypothetical protein [Candidatus Riflebacteria bacterium]
MSRPKEADVLEVSTDEIPELIKAVENSSLDDRHKQIILTLIGQLKSLKRTSREKEAALARINRLLGKKTEKEKKEKKEVLAKLVIIPKIKVPNFAKRWHNGDSFIPFKNKGVTKWANC